MMNTHSTDTGIGILALCCAVLHFHKSGMNSSESLCRMARKQDGGSNGCIENYNIMVINRLGVSFTHF